MKIMHCIFCGKTKIGYIKQGQYGSAKIEYFICIDCDKVTI